MNLPIADIAERAKHNHYLKLKGNHLFTPTGEAKSRDNLLKKLTKERGNSRCIFGTLGKHK